MMKTEEKEILVSGELGVSQLNALSKELEKNADLLVELREHCAIDRTLKVLFDESGHADLSDAVMKRLTMPKIDQSFTTSRDANEAGGKGSIVRLVAAFLVSATAAFLAGTQIFGAREDRVFDSPDLVGNEKTEEMKGGGDSVGDSSLGRLSALVASLEGNSFAQAMHEIRSTLRGPERAQAMQLLLYRWAAIDPVEALAFLDEDIDLKGWARGYADLFRAWGIIDTDAAVAAASELPGNLRHVALAGALRWLSEEDPARFIEIAGEAGLLDEGSWRLAFSGFASEDVSAATELLERVTDDTVRKAAILGIAEGLAATKPEGALDWAESLQDSQEVELALASALSAVGRQDAQLAGELLRRYPGRFHSVQKEIVHRLRKEDPFHALDWVLTYPGEESDAQLLRELMNSTAKEADQRIFDLFDTLIEREGYSVFQKDPDKRLDDVFWGSSGLDMQRGIDWALALPQDVYGWKFIVPSMVFSWATHDRASALAYVQSIEDVNVRKDLNTAIVNNMLSTSTDYEQTWDFIATLPAQLHGNDYAKVIERWARVYPSAAAERLDLVPKGRFANKAVSDVARHWGTLAPAEAAVWASELSDPLRSELATKQVAAAWAESDLMQASQWISSLAQGTARDLAVEQLVAHVAPFEGDSAFQWAMEIPVGGEARERALDTTFRSWAQQDVSAALNAIENSELTAVEQSRLRALVENEVTTGGSKEK